MRMAELTTPLLLSLMAGVECDAEHEERHPGEPDDDAGEGHAVAFLLAVRLPDLGAGDEAEDDPQDARDEEQEPADPTDQRSDGQPVRLLLHGLAVGRVGARGAVAGIAGRDTRRRARRRRRGVLVAGTWAGPEPRAAPGTPTVGDTPVARGRPAVRTGLRARPEPGWAVRSRAQAGTTCRRRPSTIQNPVRYRSCRDPSVRARVPRGAYGAGNPAGVLHGRAALRDVRAVPAA